MPLIPIRNSNAYMGFAKQAVQGTAVAPSLFPRWIDGSSIDVALKTTNVREGDGTRRVAFVMKNQQYAKIKLVCYPRPIELGFFEAAALGANSDTITAAAAPPATTITAPVTANSSTSMTIASGAGYFNAGGGTYQLLVWNGTTSETPEVATFTEPTTSNTTIAIAPGYNGGKFKFNHASGANVTSVAAANTSFTTATTAGGTTVIVGNNNGLTGSGTASLILSPGSAVEEIVTVTTPGTGTGPYTYTVAASGTTKNVHPIGDAVLSPVSHVITDKTDGAFYTVEVGLGSLFGGAGTTLRVTDCKVDQVKRTSKAGELLRLEVDLVGIASVVQASPSTVTLEAHSPFYYVTGVWTLDGVTTGDAPFIDSFDIAQKNAADVSIQSEKLTLDSIIFGSIDVTLTFQALFQNPAHVYLTYFGSATLPGTGATDSQTIGAGSLSLVFSQVDGFHTVTYACITLNYTKATPPVPKLDGKHMVLPMTCESTTNQGVNLNVLSATVANAQVAPY